jgi:putative membrane protein
MGPNTYSLVLAAHLIAVVLWVSGLTTIYWMLRFHDHAPKTVHEKLTFMERAMAMSTDIAATVAIGCGIAMSLSPINLFTTKGNGWLHLKLAVVVVAILSAHGMLRARIKRYSRGELKPVPSWLWSLLLGGVAISIFAAVTKLHTFD